MRWHLNILYVHSFTHYTLQQAIEKIQQQKNFTHQQVGIGTQNARRNIFFGKIPKKKQ